VRALAATRIALVGAIGFSEYCLHELIACRANVVAVLNPGPTAARINHDYADLGPIARQAGIPFYRIGRMSDEATIDRVRRLAPDVIFVFGLSQLIPKDVLSIPIGGCIGTHPALLPRNRGRHPLIWALVEGLEESGLTFFYLDEGVDTGDVVWQARFRIGPDDDAGTLYTKVKHLAREGICELLPRIERGTIERRPQDHAVATYWRKRTEVDGEIVWDSTVRAHNLIRALTCPYPGAHTYFNGAKVRVWRSRVAELAQRAHRDHGGEVIGKSAGGVAVQCGDGVLQLTEVEGVGIDDLAIGTRFGGVASSPAAPR